MSAHGSDTEGSGVSDTWALVDKEGEMEGERQTLAVSAVMSESSGSSEFIQLGDDAATFQRHKDTENEEGGHEARATPVTPGEQGAGEQQQQQEIAAETVALNTHVPGDDDVPESRGQDALADEAARHEDTSATPQTELDEEKEEEELHESVEVEGATGGGEGRRSRHPSASSESDFERIDPSSLEEVEGAAGIPPGASSRPPSLDSSVSSRFSFMPLVIPLPVQEVPPPREQPEQLPPPLPQFFVREEEDDDDSIPGDVDDRCESDISMSTADSSDLSSMSCDLGEIPLHTMSPLRQYTHCPNNTLNTALSVIALLSLALAVGLGIGHAMGTAREQSVSSSQVTRMKSLQDDLLICLQRKDSLEGLHTELKHNKRSMLQDAEFWKTKYEELVATIHRLERDLQLANGQISKYLVENMALQEDMDHLKVQSKKYDLLVERHKATETVLKQRISMLRNNLKEAEAMGLEINTELPSDVTSPESILVEKLKAEISELQARKVQLIEEASRMSIREQPSGSDQSEQPSGTDQSEQPFGSDQSEQPSGSDQSEQPFRSDQSEQPFGSDQSEPSFGSDQSEQSSGSDQSEQPSGSDQSEQPSTLSVMDQLNQLKHENADLKAQVAKLRYGQPVENGDPEHEIAVKNKLNQLATENADLKVEVMKSRYVQAPIECAAQAENTITQVSDGLMEEGKVNPDDSVSSISTTPDSALVFESSSPIPVSPMLETQTPHIVDAQLDTADSTDTDKQHELQQGEAPGVEIDPTESKAPQGPVLVSQQDMQGPAELTSTSLSGPQQKSVISLSEDEEPEQHASPSYDADLQPSAGADLQPSVGADLQQSVGADLQPSVGADLQPSVAADLQQSVGADLQPSVGADLQPSVGADLQPSVAADLQQSVGADLQPSVGADLQPSVGADLQQSVGADLQQSVGADLQQSVGADLQQSAGTHLQPSGGASSGVLEPVQTSDKPAAGSHVGEVHPQDLPEMTIPQKERQEDDSTAEEYLRESEDPTIEELQQRLRVEKGRSSMWRTLFLAERSRNDQKTDHAEVPVPNFFSCMNVLMPTVNLTEVLRHINDPFIKNFTQVLHDQWLHLQRTAADIKVGQKWSDFKDYTKSQEFESYTRMVKDAYDKIQATAAQKWSEFQGYMQNKERGGAKEKSHEEGEESISQLKDDLLQALKGFQNYSKSEGFQRYVNKTKKTVSVLTEKVKNTWDQLLHLSGDILRQHKPAIKRVQKTVKENMEDIGKKVRSKWNEVRERFEKSSGRFNGNTKRRQYESDEGSHPDGLRDPNNNDRSNSHHGYEDRHDYKKHKDRGSNTNDGGFEQDQYGSHHDSDTLHHPKGQDFGSQYLKPKQFEEEEEEIEMDPTVEDIIGGDDQKNSRKFNKRFRKLNNRINKINERNFGKMDEDDMEDLHSDIQDFDEDVGSAKKMSSLKNWLSCQLRWWKGRFQPQAHRQQDMAMRGCSKNLMVWQRKVYCTAEASPKRKCHGKHKKHCKKNREEGSLRSGLPSFCARYMARPKQQGEGKKTGDQQWTEKYSSHAKKNEKRNKANEERVESLMVEDTLEQDNTTSADSQDSSWYFRRMEAQEEMRHAPDWYFRRMEAKEEKNHDTSSYFHTRSENRKTDLAQTKQDGEPSWVFKRALELEYKHHKTDWVFDRAEDRDYERSRPEDWYNNRVADQENKKPLEMFHGPVPKLDQEG